MNITTTVCIDYIGLVLMGFEIAHTMKLLNNEHLLGLFNFGIILPL